MIERVEPANPHPCDDCPWRTANFNKKPDPHKLYTVTNLKRLWRGMRKGINMTCHPTDPRMVEYEGVKAGSEDKPAHECTGSLILKLRELQKFDILCRKNPDAPNLFKLYQAFHPWGMTKAGMADLMARVVMPGFGGLAVHVRDLDLNEAVSFALLGEWKGDWE
jgi:hypothetical protein